MRCVAIVLCLLVAGCGPASTPEATPQASPASSQTASSAPPATPPTSASPTAAPTTASASPTSSAKPAGTTIIAADSQFGKVLYDASGQAIYLFDAETGSAPKCYDECAQDWPPVLTEGAPLAEGEVESDLLGTTRRSDGATQVTYDGRPLYFYAHEGKNQVLCHNVEGYGGTWLAVQPNGKPVPT
jgi:predicted lipoprotein with Yx(FWY)xxD motif